MNKETIDYGEFRDMLAAVCEASVKIVDSVDHSGLVMFDKALESGKVVAEYPLTTGTLGLPIQIAGTPKAERLVRSREPIVSNDVENDQELGDLKAGLLRLGIKSIVIVPIVVDGRVKGSFSFDSIGRLRHFDQADIEKCAAFAEFASFAVRNAYLLGNLRALTAAMLAIASQNSRKDIYKAITTEAIKLLQTKSGGIDELDNDTQELVVVASNDPNHEIDGKRFRVGEGLSGRIIKDNLEELAVTDYQNWKGRARCFDGTDMLQALLGVRLQWRGQPRGTLWVTDDRGREYNESERALLKGIATPASLALEQCELRERERQKAERIQKLATTTATILRNILPLNREDRLSLIAQHARDLTNAEVCGIFLVEEPGYLALRAGYGYRKDSFVNGLKLKIESGPGKGLHGHIANEGLPLSACGEELWNHFALRQPGGMSDYTSSGLCFSFLGLPLRGDDGELKGLLSLTNKKGKDDLPHKHICFDSDDLKIAEAVAEASLVAIETADLLEQLKSKNDLYAQLLETWNTLTSEAPLEIRLQSIAKNVVQITAKSFCRISLADGVSDRYKVATAAVRARSPANTSLLWGENTKKEFNVSEFPDVCAAFKEGSPYELQPTVKENEQLLESVSRMLDLRDGVSEGPVPVRTLFSIPMTAGSRAVGILTLGEVRDGIDRRQHTFTARENERRVGANDRRSIHVSAFKPDQKNVASAIAAQATVMIDREWKGRSTHRRADLFARSSKALDVIAAEPTSSKKIEVMAEETRQVFGCSISGVITQVTADAMPRFVCSTEGGAIQVDTLDIDLSKVNELLTSTGDNSQSFSDRFGELYPSLPKCTNDDSRAILAVRFDYGATSRGILFIADDTEASDLGFGDLGVLEELSNYCAMSLTRAVMREQLTNARDGVNEIAIDLTLGDQEQALANVVKGIATMTSCDAVTLYTIRPVDREIKEPPATFNLFDAEKPKHYIKPIMESPVGRVLTKNALYIATDVSRDVIMKGGFIAREKIRSAAGIPVWLPPVSLTPHEHVGQREPPTVPVGVLFVNYRSEHTFTKDDERNIELAGHLAALAIRNHSLFNEERRKATMLNSLYEASKALARSLDLDEIWNHLAKQSYAIAHTLNRRVTHVAAKEFKDDRAIIRAAYPPVAKAGAEIGSEIDLISTDGSRSGIVGRAYKKRRSQIVGDVSKDKDYRRLFPETNSQIVILFDDENEPNIPPRGAISIESPDLHAFDESDLTAFQSLAALASDAVRNAQQLSDRQYALDREANLRDLALYYIKCGILIHNQKQPVSAIKDRVSTLLDTLANEPAKSKALNIASRILDESKNLEAISREADPSAIRLVNTDLHDLKLEWRERLSQNPQLLNVSKNVSGPAGRGNTIKIDKLLMRHLLKVFVDNSVTAMQTSAQKQFNIAISARDRQWCVIRISDSGKGIDTKLWRIIAAGKRPPSADEPRKGLRTALLIVTGLGGEINLIQSTTGGTEFEIKLPLVL